jgi:hypothetical protein
VLPKCGLLANHRPRAAQRSRWARAMIVVSTSYIRAERAQDRTRGSSECRRFLIVARVRALACRREIGGIAGDAGNDDGSGRSRAAAAAFVAILFVVRRVRGLVAPSSWVFWLVRCRKRWRAMAASSKLFWLFVVCVVVRCSTRCNDARDPRSRSATEMPNPRRPEGGRWASPGSPFRRSPLLIPSAAPDSDPRPPPGARGSGSPAPRRPRARQRRRGR